LTPAQVRRAVRREIEKLEPLIKAIACVKTAGGMANNLPDREADPDGHDQKVKALHSTVKAARQSLEDYRATVVDNAEGKGRREAAGAYAKTVLQVFGATRR
jgi:hypothetical protein